MLVTSRVGLLFAFLLCFSRFTSATRLVRVNPSDETIMNPDDVVESFQLSTLAGTFTYESRNDNSQNAMIFFALDPHSGFGEAMWGNELYVQNLFLRSPNDTNYIFLSYATNAFDVVTRLQNIFQQTMEDLHYSEAQQSQWNKRVHFCTTPVSEIDNWIPTLLAQWPTIEEDAILISSKQSNSVKRLDGRWPWMQAIDQVLGPRNEFPLFNFGDGCSPSNSTQQLNGTIALISRDSNCYWSEKFLNAQHAGAVGVAVYSAQGEPLVDINCRKISCYAVTIPVTMISFESGSSIIEQLNAGDSISIQFTSNPVSGYFFAVDCNSLLQEMGNIQYPSMSFLAWEAQYFDYYRELLNTIEESTVPGTNDFVVNIYNNTMMSGPTNTSMISFPIPKISEGYSQLLLDMDLGCPGPKDSSCPAWDRILQVFICCGNTVDSTVLSNGTETYFCDQELGRWITPFGRRVGRWLTDVTPLLPLFDSREDSVQCHFQITCGTTENWVPTLNLRFHDYQPLEERPTSLLPLYQGGTFDSSYNDNYSPIEFTIPQGTTKILLYSVITGHGSDNNGCGEFCVTSHHFVFNGRHNNSKTFYNAGTPLGCARHSSDGVEPNEFGTWLYGRDGWCDGQEVSPWIVDVTEEIDLLETNTVLYYGYYNGATPNPTENPGYIKMYSYLSFYSQ